MSKPWSICLEDLDAAERERFLRCVALVGRQPGLRLDSRGQVLWKDPAAACELWVSADDRLILYRAEGGPVAQVSRDGRSVEAPVGKPIVLLDQDEIALGGRRLRVHVHGEAKGEYAPEPLEPRSGLKRAAAKIATAAALGAAVAGMIEVRAAPPDMTMPEGYQRPDAAVGGPPDAGRPDAGQPDQRIKKEPKPTIEVRQIPPSPPEFPRPTEVPPPVAPKPPKK